MVTHPRYLFVVKFDKGIFCLFQDSFFILVTLFLEKYINVFIYYNI